MDQDKDGKISKEEAPGPLKEHFADVDANRDGQLDEAELKAHAGKVVERFRASATRFRAERSRGEGARGEGSRGRDRERRPEGRPDRSRNEENKDADEDKKPEGEERSEVGPPEPEEEPVMST